MNVQKIISVCVVMSSFCFSTALAQTFATWTEIDSFVAPDGRTIDGADFRSTDVLKLGMQFQSDRPYHYDLDLTSGTFTQQPRALIGTIDSALTKEINPKYIDFENGYTGFADTCPDGTFVSGGFGNSIITSLIFNPDGMIGSTALNCTSFKCFSIREIFGVDILDNGEIWYLGGAILDPCQDQPFNHELLRIEWDEFDTDMVVESIELIGAPCSGVGFTDYYGVDYDPVRDVFWICNLLLEDNNIWIFEGYDRAGIHRYSVALPTGLNFDQAGRLVHYRNDEFAFTNGTDTLRLIELDFDSGIPEWDLFH